MTHNQLFLHPELGEHQQWHPVVNQLLSLLEQDSSLRDTLEVAIGCTQRFREPLLASYCSLLQAMLTTVPNPTTWLPMNLEFYYVIACAPNGMLARSAQFQAWLHEFVNGLGRFLDTTASAENLQAYIQDPLYSMDDYVVSPSGWLTFNQFFARQMKPGRRPIAARSDDTVVVSPVDGSYKGCLPIDHDAQVTVKGLSWTIRDLLDDSPFADRFSNGWFAHCFLAPHNYHRFHAPVGGVLRELRNVTGCLALDVICSDEGDLSVAKSSVGYQFTQERGLAILESSIGIVAVIPVGMGIVSSVIFTADQGIRLEKGEELGYFSFGGSDVVLLFEHGTQANFLVDSGQDLRQGQAIALAKPL